MTDQPPVPPEVPAPEPPADPPVHPFEASAHTPSDEALRLADIGLAAWDGGQDTTATGVAGGTWTFTLMGTPAEFLSIQRDAAGMQTEIAVMNEWELAQTWARTAMADHIDILAHLAFFPPPELPDPPPPEDPA